MTVEIEVAWMQVRILHDAANVSPVPQVGARLRGAANEWASAARQCSAAKKADGPSIEFAGSIEPGMRVLADGWGGWVKVRRVILRDGQVSLHCDHPNPDNPRDEAYGYYLNRLGNGSPVVARSTLTLVETPTQVGGPEEEDHDDAA